LTRSRPLTGKRELDERNVGVLTVDDQPVFRDLARLVLQTSPGFRSVGQAASGEEALALVDQLEPDLVLVDVRMPGMGGIEAARQISARHPEIVVVLISIEDPRDLPTAAQSCGATTIVRKQDFGPSMLRNVWKQYGTKQ
jgi:DNA-binding NarL/FixJ family response regulator